MEHSQFKPDSIYRIANSEDGTAFDVTIDGYGCKATILCTHHGEGLEYLEVPDKLWAVKPSGEFFLLVKEDPKMTGITYGEPRGLAAFLSIAVWSQQLSKDIAGCYDDEHDAIIIDRTMTYRRKHCTLLHELLHWTHADSICGWQVDNRIEKRVRRETASTLVSVNECATAESMYDGNRNLIAMELDVTRQIIEDYQQLVLSHRTLI